MVIIGILLVAAGALTVVAALFGTSGTAAFLGLDLNSATIFFLGVAATLAVFAGLGLTRAGAGRAWRRRRDRRRLEALEREHGDRARDEGRDDRHLTRDRPGEESSG